MRRNLLILFAVSLSLFTTTAQASDWPMFRGDSTNSGYTSETLTPPLKLAWKAKVDGIVLSSPVISQGLVYAGSTSTYVYTFEAATGLEKWKYKTGGWIRYSPAVANGMVYVSSEDGYVYALDKNTGELRWKERPKTYGGNRYGTPGSSPIVVEDILYVISDKGSVFETGVCALNALTGESKWCVEAAPEALMDGASPAISNGILYIGIYDSLHAFDAKDGKLKWKYQTKSETTARKTAGMPSISNGVVYFSTSDYFYAIDASTGKEIWKGGFAPIRSSPAITNNTLYVTGYNGAVNAMDSTTGIPSWTYSYYAPGVLFSPPTISDNIVYIGSGPYLQAIDAQNGTLKWSYIVDSTLSSSPAIANNRLYIGSDGYLYAFEKSAEPLISAKIPLPLNKISLFEGYSLIFSKFIYEDATQSKRIAELELQKDGIKVDSGSYRQDSMVQLGNKGQPIIRGKLDSAFKGATVDLVQLRDITLYSENGGVIALDIGKITFSHVLGREEEGNVYWKLDNGYWLRLDIYPRTNQTIFSLEKYGINIDRALPSIGQAFSLKNDTGVTILSGTFEGITKQDNRIVAKLTNIIQYPDSRIASKTIINLTDDELKNIQSEKNNEYKPSQIIMWNLSDGYSLRLQAIEPKTTPRQAWLIFEKDGQKLDDMVKAEGEQFLHQKQVATGKGMKDVPILRGKIDRISLDPWYVVISDVRLYSESGYSIQSASFDVPSAISSAQKTIKDARSLLADASQAEYLLGQAQEKMRNGQYAESMSFAVQAKESAEGVKTARMKQYVIGLILIIGLTIFAYRSVKATRRRAEEKRQRLEKTKQEILDMIYEVKRETAVFVKEHFKNTTEAPKFERGRLIPALKAKELPKPETEGVSKRIREKAELSKTDKAKIVEFLVGEIDRIKQRYADKWYDDHWQKLRNEGVYLDKATPEYKWKITEEYGGFEKLDKETTEELYHIDSLRINLKKQEIPDQSQLEILNLLNKIGNALGTQLTEAKKQGDNDKAKELKKKIKELSEVTNNLAEISGRDLEKEAYKGGLKMGDEENIRKVKEAVEEAIRLIRAKHAGANQDEARRYLSQAGEALKNDKFEEALELARKAQLAARPTTEYLLSKARELAAGAEKNFQSKNYEEAIEQWNKAIEEYDRAGELARERKEQEIVDRVVGVKSKLKDNINKAEIAIDNREMLNLVNKGNSEVEEANKLLEAKKFEESKKAYEEAKKAFEEALSIAEKRNFDKAKIENALKSVEASIEAALLSNGEAMLQEAEESYEKKNFTEAEKVFSSALGYLKGLQVEKKTELNEMIASGSEGLIKAKLEQGREKMREADRLFKGNKIYEAKESYRTARNYLEGVRDEATSYKISKQTEELNTLIQACTQNISSATNILTEVANVDTEIIPVDKIVTGKGKFQGKDRKQPDTAPIFSFPPELLDEYSNPEYSGEGGSSWVYRAERKSDGFTVAVKIPKQFNKKTGKLFVDEIANWKDLRHKNIAKIFDYGTWPRPHIAMEFLEVSLEDVPKPMNMKRAAHIIFKIADGVKYAHKKHILHNDLKPSNILLANDEEPKIADWGMSRAMKSSTFSKGLAKGGTPLYMAPEQLRDEKVDERTDVWQLGVIFYEIVTGRPPFEAENDVALKIKILEQEPVPIRQEAKTAKELNTIIMKCLQKDKNNRYQSMEELQYDIARILDMELNSTMKITKDRLEKIKLCTDLIEIYAPLSDKRKCLMYLKELRDFVNNPNTKEKIESIEKLHGLDLSDDAIRQRIDEVIHLARIKA